MIELYAPAEFSHVKRVRLWWILAYVAFAAVMVAANVLCAVLLRPVSYWGGLILNIVLTILFGGATLFFFCLPFRMLNAYYKTYRNMNRGLKETVRGTVLRFDEEGVTKDNLECYGLVIEPNAKKSKSLPVRRILIEHTRPAPELVRGHGDLRDARQFPAFVRSHGTYRAAAVRGVRGRRTKRNRTRRLISLPIG